MEIFVVDAFTDRPFSGNPAGVVLLPEPADPAWMQSVAAELGYSDTAFVEVGGVEPLPLRWFTPTAEADLCGHATLAAAHVLGGSVVFSTRSGFLTCKARADGWIEMDFPADPPVPVGVTPLLRASLPGVTIKAVAQGVTDLLVEVGSAAEVRALRPDLVLLDGVPGRGVIVTAAGDRPDVDVVSRCFYPSFGVPEDPVTGSAHCTLAAWWAPRLDRVSLLGEQASPRGGRVQMTLRDDRVGLGGQGVTVLRGELTV